MNSSTSFTSKLTAVIVSILIVGVSFASGLYVGNAAPTPSSYVTTFKIPSNDNSAPSSKIDLSPFWKTWNLLDKKFVVTHKASSSINVSATSSTSTGPVINSLDTPQNRLYGAIKGMVASLGDPYTVFFTPEESKTFTSEINGNFEGIGMELGIKDGILTVVTAIKDTPAFKAGLTSGDKIIKINEVISAGISTDQAVSLIRGKKGTDVTLTILRGEEKEPRVIKVTRDVINLPTIDAQLRSDGVFVIRLYTFTQDSPNLFRAALRQFVESNSNKLILDLRGNPGGLVDAAVDIASWFLPQGKIILQEVSTPIGTLAKDSVNDTEVLRSKGYDIFSKNLQMAILINGGSASASEILAGALNEYGVAKLVGTKSFGKGSVQELVQITDDALLKVTIARWLTPNGKSISEGGLTPDIQVELTADDFAKKQDPQLEKAASLLKGF